MIRVLICLLGLVACARGEETSAPAPQTRAARVQPDLPHGAMLDKDGWLTLLTAPERKSLLSSEPGGIVATTLSTEVAMRIKYLEHRQSRTAIWSSGVYRAEYFSGRLQFVGGCLVLAVRLEPETPHVSYHAIMEGNQAIGLDPEKYLSVIGSTGEERRPSYARIGAISRFQTHHDLDGRPVEASTELNEKCGNRLAVYLTPIYDKSS